MNPLMGTARGLSPPTADARHVTVPPWAEGLIHILERAFVIPGTKFRVGLDPILGLLVPGAGDAASAIANGALLWVAFRARVSRVIQLRMLVNILVDALFGAIPLVGDLFDLGFRAGERNLALLRKHAIDERRPAGFGDYAILAVAFVCLLSLLALPILLGLALIHVATLMLGG